jgi:hypothetical protein
VHKLKIRVLVVAPYPGLARLAAELAGELEDFDIQVLQGDLDEVLPELPRYEEKGCDIVISRGGTARLIRRHTTLPVVEIQVSGYDIMRLVALLDGCGTAYEMIGFANIIENVIAVAGLMNVFIPCRKVGDESEVDAAILDAKRRGKRIVVGDAVTVRKAKEAGMETILITSGRESVLDAFARAKQMHLGMAGYRNRATLYRRMLTMMAQGSALFGEDGELQEANEAYRSMVQAPDESRFLRDFVKRVAAVKDAVVRLDHDRLLRVTGEHVQLQGESHVYVLVRKAGQSEESLVVHHAGRFLETFPPLIDADLHLTRLLERARRTADPDKPVLLYGEKGAGKRLLVAELLRDGPGALELEVVRPGGRTLDVLKSWVDRLAAGSVIHLRGVDKMDDAAQTWLADTLGGGKIRWILSCEQEPRRLHEQRRMAAVLYKRLKRQSVHVPPLRERSVDLESCIRLFIAKSNEKYGKQVAGVRREVMAELIRYPWPGNWMEMRDTVDAIVKHAAGPFVESDALSLLGTCGVREGETQAGTWINLRQPLEMIEREIIEFVLRDEDMNQTKAAERLGINRSTLWRKLKIPPGR